jgi:hypothetical protein
MTPEELRALISVGLQVPIVMAFMVFVIFMIRSFNAESARRDKQFIETIKTIEAAHTNALKEVQALHSTAMGRLAEEIKKVTEGLIASTNLLTTHDLHGIDLSDKSTEKVAERVAAHVKRQLGDVPRSRKRRDLTPQ